MLQKLGNLSLLVKDLDEALAFYTDKLGFKKTADIKMPNGFRWLTVAPDETSESGIVFVKAENAADAKLTGRQAEGHVLFTLHTTDCRRDYEIMKARGVQFAGEPKSMPWGTEVVLEDCYGNHIDLVQPF